MNRFDGEMTGGIWLEMTFFFKVQCANYNFSFPQPQKLVIAKH